MHIALFKLKKVYEGCVNYGLIIDSQAYGCTL